ncbi:trans-aconitate 2-methyltransferase [Pseudarthrobacter sp. NamE5]|uniref:trans-aconitate 2-methyltransferase n=1 Tax=Pseudarthrobacter sp. NamE5 TaxID=2576839 RepID=UPI00110BF0F4|nr:trans-aconitate 2-methyltransferase [Pseudarthrobacter sp. NamE5]TLM87750.1 trans-aconitate 2-methyltransferase [Pseudarthrobacter sp. NamE5]
MKWDPAQYVQFGDHRDRPFFDLTGRIHADRPVQVVDLGCGPGNLTATLAERWPGAEVVGVDSSQEMLAKAAHLAEGNPSLRFELADIAGWKPSAETDVVVSNAALQWVPGHQDMMRSWLQDLRPGAWFALQVPGNFNAPSHALMRDLAASQRWAPKLGQVLRGGESVGEPADYLHILLDAGYAADAWETTYQQVLPGRDAVLEWVRGTALRPVLAVLTAEEGEEFEAAYAAALREAYPRTGHGAVFPFRRTFAVGRKRD